MVVVEPHPTVKQVYVRLGSEKWVAVVGRYKRGHRPYLVDLVWKDDDMPTIFTRQQVADMVKAELQRMLGRAVIITPDRIDMPPTERRGEACP